MIVAGVVMSMNDVGGGHGVERGVWELYLEMELDVAVVAMEWE